MNKRSAFTKMINLIIILAFAGVTFLNYWYAVERQKLNQRYEQSIEQFENVIQDYEEMAVLLRGYVQKLQAE